MSVQTVYKVVRRTVAGRYFSVNPLLPDFLLTEYFIGTSVFPPVTETFLMVFDNLVAAKHFAWFMGASTVLEGEGEIVDIPYGLCIYDGDFVDLGLADQGVAFVREFWDALRADGASLYTDEFFASLDFDIAVDLMLVPPATVFVKSFTGLRVVECL